MNTDVNILMLGGAKRVSFATKLAIHGYRIGLSVNLFSWELSKIVPAACVAEIIEGPRWSDPDILEKLHQVVIEKKIDMIIPFVDPAIAVAVKYRDKYGKVFVPAGDLEGVEAMFNKIEAARVFEQHKLPVPATYHQGDTPEFPLIAKPACGSASHGIKILRDQNDLDRLGNADDYLIQTYVAGATEITVDCYVNRKGEIITTVPRERLAVIDGEVSHTITVADREAIELAVDVLKKLDFKGAVTVQCLRDPASGRLLLMEVNPRFGGGVVCSIHAGANFPEFLFADFAGIQMSPCVDWRPGTEITRYMTEVVFYNGHLQG